MRGVLVAPTVLAMTLAVSMASGQVSRPPVDPNSAAFEEGRASAARARRTRPPFYGARERWTCTFVALSKKSAIIYIGLYGWYAKDDFDSTLAIISDTANALVLADSSYGDKAYDGTPITQISRTLVIDRRDHSFKLAFQESDPSKSGVLEGVCSAD